MSVDHQPPIMASLGRVRAFLIDLDGTLVDTLGDFEAALQATLSDLGLDAEVADRAFVALTVGKGSEHLVRQALKAAGAGPTDTALEARAQALYQQHYGRVNGAGVAVYPGVREALKELQRWGGPVACLTNKPTGHALRLLDITGLRPYFSVVHGGDAFPRKKPDPMPLLETCRGWGLPPSEVVMVGDSVNDAQAAQAAGCPVVLVTYGYNHGQPIAQVPAAAHVRRLDHWLQGLGLTDKLF